MGDFWLAAVGSAWPSIFLVRCLLGPELGEFVDIEICEDRAVDLNDRRQCLAGFLYHFDHGGAVGNDVQGFILNPLGIQPIDGLVAPAAERFDEQFDLVRCRHG